jgi:hypothetical protein
MHLAKLFALNVTAHRVQLQRHFMTSEATAHLGKKLKYCELFHWHSLKSYSQNRLVFVYFFFCKSCTAKKREEKQHARTKNMLQLQKFERPTDCDRFRKIEPLKIFHLSTFSVDPELRIISKKRFQFLTD